MRIAFPDKLAFLFEPARYKIAYGGRGGSKSWAFADALLIQAAKQPLRVLCAREIQKSMRESVHQLLRDRIAALGLADFYTVLNDEIRGNNGSAFIFAGLKHNVESIKSKEGLDRVWIEEANTVSKHSWDTLIPTVRKEGSEIWISFNPELDTDETYRRFILNAPAEFVDGKRYAFVVKVGWQDNPWFPDVLRLEKDALKQRDPDGYLTVWEGHCRQTLDGAIYAKEIRSAAEQSRITKVPYDPNKPVQTFWDLGRSDKTAIWFAQIVGFEFHIIDYYDNSGEALAHYMKVLQGRPYVYAEHWLPHDAEHELLASERTIKQQMIHAGFRVRIVPKVSVADGINAARTIFPNCWFDEAKCADGLNALRRYRYDVDPDSGVFSKTPLHDENSHAADAWRYLGVALREPKKPKKAEARDFHMMPQGWMG